jgi:hypothetical protein
MLGVAQGNGPFKETSWRGEIENRAQFPRNLTLRYSSFDNPFAEKEALADLLEGLSPEDYANLVLAQWGMGIGKVFANVREVVDHRWPIHQHANGHFYTQPADWPGISTTVASISPGSAIGPSTRSSIREGSWWPGTDSIA